MVKRVDKIVLRSLNSVYTSKCLLLTLHRPSYPRNRVYGVETLLYKEEDKSKNERTNLKPQDMNFSKYSLNYKKSSDYNLQLYLTSIISNK